ncbi:EphrinB2like, partial [Caligus rogercresseyi]
LLSRKITQKGHLLLGVLLVLSQGLADCTAIHNLYWNASNPLFAVGGELRLDVNGGNHPWEYDQYPRSKTAGHQETYIIYSVSRQEYETCRVTSASPKIFEPGKDYYFVSTSSKDDIQRRVSGYCTSHNMRVIFH